MRTRRIVAGIGFGLALFFGQAWTVSAQCLPHTSPESKGNLVYQMFPANGPEQSRWQVRWALVGADINLGDSGGQHGLAVYDAWYRKSPGSAWIRVLYRAELAQAFVDYHHGKNDYYDLDMCGGMHVLGAPFAGSCGKLLGPSDALTTKRVVREVRDYGVAWSDGSEVRRGEELVLWGVYDACNYKYVIEYAFRDDGTMVFRAAPTGANLHTSDEDGDGSKMHAHMHDFQWRVDMDLDGHQGDSAQLVQHLGNSTGQLETDPVTPLATEQGQEWIGEEFSAIRLEEGTLENDNNNPTSYDFVPFQMGVSRHQEAFSEFDFYVTKFRWTELQYSGNGNPSFGSTSVVDYLTGESVMNDDVVVWLETPVHHLPRDEDLGPDGMAGSALTLWSGFHIRPRNLHSSTPFYPASSEG